MLRHYFTITIRHLRRHKGYSILNVFGLAIGMVCAILIGLYVQDELSYDRFHENADRIFRVSSRGMIGNTYSNHTQTPAPMAKALKRDFSDIEQF